MANRVIVAGASGIVGGAVARHETARGREVIGLSRRPPQGEEWAGTGRELFAAFRATVGPADEGASVFAAVDATPTLQEVRVDQHA